MGGAGWVGGWVGRYISVLALLWVWNLFYFIYRFIYHNPCFRVFMARGVSTRICGSGI